MSNKSATRKIILEKCVHRIDAIVKYINDQVSLFHLVRWCHFSIKMLLANSSVTEEQINKKMAELEEIDKKKAAGV